MINHPFLTKPSHIEIREYLLHSRHITWGNNPDSAMGIFQDWIKLNFFQYEITWLEIDMSLRLKHGFNKVTMIIIDINVYYINDDYFLDNINTSPMAKMSFGSGIIYRPD